MHLILHHARMDQSQSKCPTAGAACFYFNHQCLGFVVRGGSNFLACGNIFAFIVISIVPFERGLDLGVT